MVYQYDKPKEGETLEEYLYRHNAHPKSPNRRAATQEEEDMLDVTASRVGTGILIETGKKPGKES